MKKTSTNDPFLTIVILQFLFINFTIGSTWILLHTEGEETDSSQHTKKETDGTFAIVASCGSPTTKSIGDFQSPLALY